MTVVWCVVPFVVVFAGIYAAHLMAPVGVREDTTSCRPSDPQRGAADGTGVERGALRDADADLTVLPRSPLANSQPTPTFSQAGSSQAPAAAGDPRRPAAAGLHRKRVVLNG